MVVPLGCRCRVVAARCLRGCWCSELVHQYLFLFRGLWWGVHFCRVWQLFSLLGHYTDGDFMPTRSVRSRPHRSRRA